MKKKDFLKTIKAMDLPSLKEEGRKISEELMRLRFKRSSQQQVNSSLFQILKKNLARVNTVITSMK